MRNSERAGKNRSGSTKQDKVIEMLRRPEGVTVDEVGAVTGWQRHTVRGVISALKKKAQITVVVTKEDRGRVYRNAPRASA
jgi:predicted ArsR family transcriptional regulator